CKRFIVCYQRTNNGNCVRRHGCAKCRNDSRNGRYRTIAVKPRGSSLRLADRPFRPRSIPVSLKEKSGGHKVRDNDKGFVELKRSSEDVQTEEVHSCLSGITFLASCIYRARSCATANADNIGRESPHHR